MPQAQDNMTAARPYQHAIPRVLGRFVPVELDGDHLEHPVRCDSRVQDHIGNATSAGCNSWEDGVIGHVKGSGMVPCDLQIWKSSAIRFQEH